MAQNNSIDASLPISGANGGTGVANTGRTMTLGGNVTTAGAFTLSGAFASTFTFTNVTNVTFPESGTLATTAGTIANADNIGIADDTTTNATMYPVWVTANTGYLPPRVTSTKLSFNPSTGTLSTTLYTGTWNGNVISGTYGGTGVNNGASTITIGGNVTFSGAFTFTGTVTGDTSVTFPTSGTLATTTQVVTANNVTGTSASLAVNNLYVANNAGLVTLTLPNAASVGDRIFIRGGGAGGWSIAQNANQIIHAGSSASTTGVGGSLSSTNRYDCVDLTCIVANLEFVCNGIQGNLTIV